MLHSRCDTVSREFRSFLSSDKHQFDLTGHRGLGWNSRFNINPQSLHVCRSIGVASRANGSAIYSGRHRSSRSSPSTGIISPRLVGNATARKCRALAAHSRGMNKFAACAESLPPHPASLYYRCLRTLFTHAERVQRRVDRGTVKIISSCFASRIKRANAAS